MWCVCVCVGIIVYLAKNYPAAMLSRSMNYFTKDILEYVSLLKIKFENICITLHPY